jgi:O-acetyl-ADP-ribose deacetylase (regulator of RNase III)
VTGDATAPDRSGPVVIAHVCNDLGRWGRGFVMALSKRWPEPRERFVAWHESGASGEEGPFELGRVQFVRVEPDLWVANVIGQHGLTAKKGVAPVRYDAICTGLTDVARFAAGHRATVHMPRIACGLAGGTWDKVEPLIADTLLAAGVETFVYDLPGKRTGRPQDRGQK